VKRNGDAVVQRYLEALSECLAERKFAIRPGSSVGDCYGAVLVPRYDHVCCPRDADRKGPRKNNSVAYGASTRGRMV